MLPPKIFFKNSAEGVSFKAKIISIFAQVLIPEELFKALGTLKWPSPSIKPAKYQ
jgi:hypothetical protein